MVQGSLPNDSRPSVAGVVSQTGAEVGSMVDRLRSSLMPDPYRTSSWTADRHEECTLVQRLVSVIPRLVLCATILFLALAIGLFAFRAMYNDKIYPAVVVGDVNVGGLTADQARDKVNQRAAELEQGTVTFSYGGQTWNPTLAELGVKVDTNTSVAQAQELGRGEDAVSRLTFTGDILQGDQQVPLTMTLDEGVLNIWFDTVDGSLGDPATDATIVIEGTTVSITPDVTGTLIDREAARSQIVSGLASLTPVAGDLPVVISQPKITVADLEPTAASLESALSQSVTVEINGQSWRIDPDTFAQYLSVTTSADGGQVKATVNVDSDGLAQELRDTYEADVNTEPVNARIVWDDAEGGLVARDTSTDGQVLKAPEFAEAVTASFLGDHNRVQIPVVVTKPDIDSNNLDALNIDHQIARGNSNYTGSTDQRATNIGVGVGLLNGTLIKPGEDFSFNQAIGEITADKGYVEASVVVAERVGKDIGGGICQVSTTVFRAALMGGFPIGQWNPHTYRIKGYEQDGWGPGFDASILQEGDNPAYWGDFTFNNNTDGWLLIQSWASYPYVVVEIYGQDDGREVEISGEYASDPIIEESAIEYVDPEAPAGTMELSESPLAGLEWGYMRNVDYPEDSGKEDAERWFGGAFKARGNVYRVSPDMEGESPAG